MPSWFGALIVGVDRRFPLRIRCISIFRGVVLEVWSCILGNPKIRLRAKHREAVVGRADKSELRARVQPNLFDVRAHFGLRSNYLGLGAEFVSYAVAKHISKKHGFIARRFGSARGRDQIVGRGTVAAGQ